ncbi:MAG: hypothetical protein J2P15_07855 [Micromonosporaceae bacterium]|nr:hypothetical protein [Micromonosporaceae bacterium]
MNLDRTKALAARYRAATDRPYLAKALYALSVVESTTVSTMAVDRHWRCYLNPSFVDETPLVELAGVWVHEVSHLLRDHAGRTLRLPTEYRVDHRRVNVAEDCEINDDLLADGLRLPEGAQHPSRYALPEGRLFEQYLPGIPPSPSCTSCGSGAHGRAEVWDLGVTGAPAVSAVEAQAIRRNTAGAIRARQRSQGDIPAGWRRWAEQVLEPLIDWRQVLAGSIRQAVAWASGAADYTHQRPSRRAASQPRVVLPSLRRPVPCVAVVVDTSESMGDSELAAALAEVAGVLRSVGLRGNRVTVISCDAAVNLTRRVCRAEEVEFAGGGGTDLRVGIEAALAQPQRPDVVVVLTDGYTPWPAHPPAARLVAGLLGADPPAPPPWIESARIGT